MAIQKAEGLVGREQANLHRSSALAAQVEWMNRVCGKPTESNAIASETTRTNAASLNITADQATTLEVIIQQNPPVNLVVLDAEMAKNES